MTKYHRLGHLKNRNVFLIVAVAKILKMKMTVPADLDLNALLNWQMATFLLSLHVIERKLWHSFLFL